MKFHYKVMAVLLLLHQQVSAQFDIGRAGFSVIVNNEIYSHEVFATYVLPRESIIIRPVNQTGGQITVSSETGTLENIGEDRWLWTAPARTGLTQISISRDDDERIILNVFILVPSAAMKDGYLNGKLIGDYPPPLGSDPLYAIPDGFIEVTRENQSTKLSPHFTLGQFYSDVDSGLPGYIVLRERLLLKLEALLERANENGVETNTFRIIAGYLTPDYVIKSGRDFYSRHIYGGAALIAIDNDPQNDKMDDLNGDGKEDDNDARILFDIADRLYQEPDKRFLSGGLFLYREANNWGPYLMIDARGYRQRWSNEDDLYQNPFKVRQTDAEILDED